jgi:glutamate/tyrosine decarboxylase-like PLP-dependent enzyme
VHRFTAEEEHVARQLAQFCLERLAEEVPLDHPLTPTQLDALVGQMITPEGLGGEELLRLWRDVLGPACLSVDHRRYLSFIPSAPTKAAAAFDMLVGASSVYSGSWLEGSGAVYAENQALRWIADLAGLPPEAGGVFVQGGTIGNLSALVAAREAAKHRRGGRLPRPAVCVTQETHSSVKHALQVVMDVEAVEVPGDDRGRMLGSALRETVAVLADDLRDGIFAVVATAGSTNLGMVDDIAGIADMAREHGWWLHVDAAYGGAAAVLDSHRWVLAGCEHADSIVVNPHKWLFTPIDCSVLYCRREDVLKQAFSLTPAYLTTADGQARNLMDYGASLGRRFRALKLWFVLRAFGIEGARARIAAHIAMAKELRAWIEKDPDFELLAPTLFSTVVFRHRGGDALNERIHDSVNASGEAFISHTDVRGRYALRIAIGNLRTTLEDVRATWELIQELAGS